MLRRWLLACAFVATVLVAALSHDAVVWAQGYGGVGFPRGGGPARGLLDALYCQLASPCVLTGNNSGGTGTLRIRPSDEDTQLVLCEGGNNASPEVCGSVTHANFSTALTYTQLADNAYIDSAGAIQRNNTAFGIARYYAQTGNTNASNAVGLNVWSTNATQSGDWTMAVTAAGTSTITVGATGTVTNDFRGPITNGGSATCNGINAGWTCINDDTMVYSAQGLMATQSNVATGLTGVIYYSNSGTEGGFTGFGNASVSDADYASRVLLRGNSKLISINRVDDVAAGSAHTEFRDNSSGTGVLLMDLLGNGTVRPLLYGSQTDCTDNAGAAACGAAPTGAVVLDDGATTVVVSTTAVTANSTISVNFDPSLGTKLGITCNTTQTFPYVSARTAATSFTITSADPAGANKVCVSYSIVN